jgi:hypothetical protein
MVLGSCFADGIGAHLASAGFDVCVNPFGTLYNPASILTAAGRLNEGTPFSEQECVEMGAGAGLVCTFSHHTSFARKTVGEFLENANAALAEASEKWQRCNKVIITLGTAWAWMHDGTVVANCLKRPASEFTHELLGIGTCRACLAKLVSGNPDKEFIFTVSPIRHLSLGAHANTLSKSTLHLALEGVLGPTACYFPAYEILLDELRDYRYFADDLTHPSAAAVDYIWEKFSAAAIPGSEYERMRINEKTARLTAHRPILR